MKVFTMNIRRFIFSTWGIALLVAIGWQCLLAIVGLIFEKQFSLHDPSTISPLSHMAYWDAGWYHAVFEDTYHTNAASAVFYPLFPLAVHVVQFLSFGALSELASGLVVNTLSLWAAISALVGIGQHFSLKKAAWWLPVLFLTSPAAFFLHMFYGEAIFCAIAFWAYLFALQHKWAYMAAALALLTAARLPAILFIGLCGLEFLRAHGWNIHKSLNKQTLWFLAAPLGVIAFAIYLHFVRGDFLAMVHAYDATHDWDYHVLNPNFLYTIASATKRTLMTMFGLAPYSSNSFVNNVLPVFSLGILGLASLYTFLIKKRDLVPLGLFGLASIVFFTLNSNTVSVHRYVLPCLLVYLVPVLAAKRWPKLKPLLFVAVLIGVLLQAYLLKLFVSSNFAG